MNRRICKIILLCCIVVVALCVISCGGGEDPTAESYTIQYSDASGAKTLTVSPGLPYAIETIPEKKGHNFLGLYDAPVGGTQYVDANGSSVSTFTDNKNIVLFPQFAPKTYTLVLDFAGGTVSGSRSYQVVYGQTVPELPVTSTIEHHVFKGWYTQPNCGGNQVGDTYGLLVDRATVNEKNFDLANEDGFIYLYAGFEGEMYNVTLYFDEALAPEEVKVPYGTRISEVVTETRVDGKAVLTWSKKQNDTTLSAVFNGKVTDDMVLYAAEFAPIIDFNANGGDELAPIVAREGSKLILPVAEREYYRFAGWVNEDGAPVTLTTMPTNSMTLKATWQAVLVFDENGGTEVTDISQSVGTTVTLPTPTRDGYLFAGWYTDAKDKYTATAMPKDSLVLKAGWYKKQTVRRQIVEADDSISRDGDNGADGFIIDMNTLDPNGTRTNDLIYQVDVYAYINHNWYGADYTNVTFAIYSQNEFSESTRISEKKTFQHNNLAGYQERQYSATVTDADGIFYLFLNSTDMYYLSDFYIIVSYPDTSELIL